MNNHLTEAHRNSCNHCIKTCENTVNELQKLITKCISTVKQDCAQEIGACVNRAQKSIQACNDCIENCKKHIFQCKNAACNSTCDACIKACLASIKSCQALISSCESGDNNCVNHAQKALTTLNDCARACAQCLDL